MWGCEPGGRNGKFSQRRMADCPQMTACRMFPLFKMAGALQVWKINYCTGDFAACARYRLACKAEQVPDELLPNGRILKRER